MRVKGVGRETCGRAQGNARKESTEGRKWKCGRTKGSGHTKRAPSGNRERERRTRNESRRGSSKPVKKNAATPTSAWTGKLALNKLPGHRETKDAKERRHRKREVERGTKR